MREQKILPALHVFDIAEEGKGVARAEDLVVFIEKAIPGDVVDAAVYKKKKKFAEAKIASACPTSKPANLCKASKTDFCLYLSCAS